MLWTDKGSRDFIAREYSWFLPTFDGYKYPIQRADAIRYFVLHYYGGIYLDLDVGCLRPLDPLLTYPVILAKTIPVGVSNDLMFSAKEHPFMAQTIHNLITFDHNWILNYPTVMFSTGPMFVSAQYGLYTASHPASSTAPGGEVRILSKALYGKNAKPGEAPHAFFSHHYGSSWHADDAAFITFLGTWGRILMRIGIVVLVLGLLRVYWVKRGSHGGIRRRWISARHDLWPLRFDHLRHRSTPSGESVDLGYFSYSSSTPDTTSPNSPDIGFSDPTSPSDGTHLSLLPISFDTSPGSPAPSSTSTPPEMPDRPTATVADVFRRAGTWVVGVPTYFSSSRSARRGLRDAAAAYSRLGRGRSRSNLPAHTRGGSDSVVTLLPAIFTPAPSTSSDPMSARRERHFRSAKAEEAGFNLPVSDDLGSGRAGSSEGRPGTPLESRYSNFRPELAHPSPLLIDPLGGSDVRTTRSASASMAEGLPPPYRSSGGRSPSHERNP
ncbi:glycosyltransferase family 32 protein [Hydnum rufescens UP504]|uniref:Glycosyltransferase family 32 protein n=1 Tax=Hydnum rufescens UP504 TaxID=1448309 RepID=A0A9P6DSH0_9AGAM|nr:glycosyltransferase family 32 protein [Hydnum rufescens UP504]